MRQRLLDSFARRGYDALPDGVFEACSFDPYPSVSAFL